MIDLDKLRTDKILGVGCSTFGGSTAPQASRMAMARAYDQGLVYFDVARSYGYGQAEALVGQFAQDKRSKVLITSKCGIVPPQIPLQAFTLWGLRHLRKVLPTSRQVLTSAANHTLKRQILTPQFIENSLHTSLRELKTDYIDIFLLHESHHTEYSQDDVRLVLEKAKEQGKIRMWGATVADRECLQQQLQNTAPLEAMQFPFGLDATYNDVLERGAFIRIVYSVLSYYKSLPTADVPSILTNLKAEFPRLEFIRTLTELHLYLAFAQLPAGVMLSSMTTPKNIDRNVLLFRHSLEASAAEINTLKAYLATCAGLAPVLAAKA